MVLTINASALQIKRSGPKFLDPIKQNERPMPWPCFGLLGREPYYLTYVRGCDLLVAEKSFRPLWQHGMRRLPPPRTGGRGPIPVSEGISGGIIMIFS